ncbi:MAG: transcriptional repressor, partial [Oligoflexia bacterium]|nr:transcriptional repressor [Oligoflexia bacterium]
REAMLQLLYTQNRPLTHQEIISRKTFASFDRVTIYRTLDTLQKVGLLHKILGSDGVWRFCAHKYSKETKCGGNHIHFFCSECNQMCCMPEQPLPWINPPKGAKIISKQLLVHGLCATCASKLKEK